MKGSSSMQATLPTSLSYTRPERAFHQTLSGKIVFTMAASAFVAACAHVSLPLPFTPVPLTLSNFAVLLVGMFLGPVAGFSALALYLAEGAMGLPVFTPGGAAGMAHLLGPNGGFLFAYPVAAAIAGLARRGSERMRTPFAAALAVGVAATAVILLAGARWLQHWMHLSAMATWHFGVEPFVFGECAKIVAAAGIFSASRRWTRA
jgi:biotin transport system substrate-specific component